MSDYLLTEAALTLTEKLSQFALRTEINQNPHTYNHKKNCEKRYQEFKSKQYIFDCLKQKKKEGKLNYEDIPNGSL